MGEAWGLSFLQWFGLRGLRGPRAWLQVRVSVVSQLSSCPLCSRCGLGLGSSPGKASLLRASSSTPGLPRPLRCVSHSLHLFPSSLNCEMKWSHLPRRSMVRIKREQVYTLPGNVVLFLLVQSQHTLRTHYVQDPARG